MHLKSGDIYELFWIERLIKLKINNFLPCSGFISASGHFSTSSFAKEASAAKEGDGDGESDGDGDGDGDVGGFFADVVLLPPTIRVSAVQ